MEESTKGPVNRRSFLKGAAAGAAAFVANPALAAEPQAENQTPAAAGPAKTGVSTRPASDFMVDVFKSLGIEYAMAMCAGNFAGITESVVHYGGNKSPEWITCMNEESSVEIAIGYAKIEGKPPLVCAHASSNGKIVFMKAGCYSCHGTVGQGGPAGPRLAPMKLSNQTFVNTVRNGRKDEDQSVYWDGMPAYSARFVTDSELTEIYAYLASIPAPPPLKDIPLLAN